MQVFSSSAWDLGREFIHLFRVYSVRARDKYGRISSFKTRNGRRRVQVLINMESYEHFPFAGFELGFRSSGSGFRVQGLQFWVGFRY